MKQNLELADIVAEALGIARDRAESLLESKSTRIMRYRGITYVSLRRDLAGHYEGTVILVDEKTGGYHVVEGYPHIKRILLLERAVPRHFIDEVVVEEKMDGHNVRVVEFNDEILAITRGGLVCPYTTHRIRLAYEDQIRKLLDYAGADTVIAGEVVGLENPYTRYHYPEAPEWDYFVFDIFKSGEPMPVFERRRLVDDAGMKSVPLHGRVPKDDWRYIAGIAAMLDDLGREGVVLKDPLYRVEPLKYTTSFINVNDIREGMKYPFDEGHTFIFSRVLRQMFKAIEEEWSEEKLREEAARLGEAILVPAVESIVRYIREGKIQEEFTLTFRGPEAETVLEEFIDFSAKLGIHVAILGVEKWRDLIKVKMSKPKKTAEVYKRILRTGLSPLD